eukprot:COSAG01_NODE_59954_length_297_cov_0.787879_1_plen_77_part_01
MRTQYYLCRRKGTVTWDHPSDRCYRAAASSALMSGAGHNTIAPPTDKSPAQLTKTPRRAAARQQAHSSREALAPARS